MSEATSAFGFSRISRRSCGLLAAILQISLSQKLSRLAYGVQSSNSVGCVCRVRFSLRSQELRQLAV